MTGFGAGGDLALAAGGGGGSAAGVGFRAALGPFAIVGAGVGLALGAIAQHSSNKAIKKAAIAAQRQLNVQITQARIKFVDDVRRRSAVGQMVIAQSRNRFGTQTGLSISERLAAIAADMTLDTEALRAARDARLSAIAFEKSRLVAGGEAQSGSVGLAALQGAVGGAQAGLALSGALKELGAIDQATQNARRISSLFGELDTTRRITAFMQADTLRLFLSNSFRQARILAENSSAIRGIEGGLGIEFP